MTVRPENESSARIGMNSAGRVKGINGASWERGVRQIPVQRAVFFDHCKTGTLTIGRWYRLIFVELV